jgi:sporadic carbohydrate cluster 2OG-Fe(II) oxygenase
MDLLKLNQIKKEVDSGKGYTICKIENFKLFKHLRKLFVKSFKKSYNNFSNIDFLRKKIAKMSKAEINKAMIDLFIFNKDLSEMMILCFPKLIEFLCGKKLFIQRRAHTTINSPGINQAKQVAHYEMISGVSPFSYIIWAPLHDIDDEGGAYHIDLNTSLRIMKKEEKKGLVSGPDVLNFMGHKTPPKLKFGEAIIFNPFVIHGNIPFHSDKARIACNVRFQSSKKPLLQKNTDYLKYFVLS